VQRLEVIIKRGGRKQGGAGMGGVRLIPRTPWTSIILDFMVKLLLLQDPIIGVEYDSILVVTDRLTKYIYMILYLEASIIEDLAYMFLRVVVANYSALEKMISDKDKFFISRFWKVFTVLLGIKRKLSTSFHTQTDD
jgi:hypothetical protein